MYGAIEAFKDEYVTSFNHHGDKVNLMGFITANGVGELILFEDNMTGEMQKKLLQQGLLPTARAHLDNQPWKFLHDNDKKFHSHVVQDWLFENGVTCLDFPPYSPDLNPIENLWADLKRRVQKRRAKTMEELKRVIMEEWRATPTAYCRSLLASMRSRCQKVIDNHGFKSRY